MHQQSTSSDIMSVNQSYQFQKNIKLSSQKVYFISGYYAIPDRILSEH